MTPRRLAALAQALAIAAILVPGPHPAGHAPVSAAAAGKGVGCTAGIGTYRGPGLPGDPPAPPGAVPKPSATASPSQAPAGSPDTSIEASTDAAAAEPEAGAPTIRLASTSVRLAQADPSEEPEASPEPDAEPEPSVGREPDAEPEPSLDPEPDAEPGAEPTPRPQRGRQVRGIDVSHHNGDIDYAQVLQTGRTFAFIKATQDTSFRDPMYELNVSRARLAGVYHGAYHFFDYTLDGTAQADHFLDGVEAAGGLLGALPPVVDVECWRPSGVSTHVTAAARLRDFVARVYERTARLPMVYTSVFMWDQVVGASEGFEHLPLWAACWGCDAPPSLAPGWDDWRFWQTGVGRIAKVGRLDANVFNGSLEELDALRLRPFSVADGAVAVGSPEVTLDLGGRDGDRYRTSLDGSEWSRWQALRGTPRAELAPSEGVQTLYLQLRLDSGPLSPVLSDTIALDLTGPEVTQLAATLPLGPMAGADDGDDGLPVALSWTASDELSGLGDASLSVSCDGEGARRTDIPGSIAPGTAWPWESVTRLDVGVACDVLVVARDGVGNVSRDRLDGLLAEVLASGPSEAVHHAGEWRALEDALSQGAPSYMSDSPEAAMTARLSGDQAGVVARRGPNGGLATISLDGEPVGRVDLYAPVATGPAIVFVAELGTEGSQELTVQALGSGEPASGGAEVAIDGFVTLAVGVDQDPAV